MDQNPDLLRELETELFDALEAAEKAGLDQPDGEFAFQRGMTALDLVTVERTERIYEPLSADPVTRDYVLHLDSQLQGLVTRIDVLRARIELSLQAGLDDRADLHPELHRLAAQLRARFRREAALLPVYQAWQDRQDRMSA